MDGQIDRQNFNDTSLYLLVSTRCCHVNPLLYTVAIFANLRTSTDEIKTTCSKLSSVCGLSPEMTWMVVKIECKELYNHVYLSADEQLFGEEGILPNQPKEKGKNPVSASELKNLTYVICSARTISDYK